MSIFDTTAQRSGTCAEKYNKQLIALFAGNGEAAPFWVADMDFRTPEAILSAIRQELDIGVLGYPGIKGVKESFIEFAEKRHDWKVDPSLVVIAPGMLSSIAFLIEMYSSRGDKVLLPFPAYKPFVKTLNRLEREIIPLHLPYNEETHRFSFPEEAYRETMALHKPSIVLFCSPHNPTGIVFDRNTLEQVALSAKEHEALLISDEIHADLAYPGEVHVPIHRVTEGKQMKSATCMAPSKTFNIAGEHFSVVVCSDIEMKKQLVSRFSSLNVGPDYLATIAARSAYQEGYPWLMELLPYLERNVEMIENLLCEHDSSISLVRPQGSFIALLDCSRIFGKLNEQGRTPHSSEAGILSEFFGKEASVALNDGSWFGQEYRQFVRLNFATSSEQVKKAILSMIKAEKALLA